MSSVKLRWNPALTTLLFLVGLLLAWLVLHWATGLGAGTSRDLVDSGRFQAWVVVAAFAVVAFADTLLAGVREVRGDRLPATSPSPTVYGWLFVVFAAIVLGTLRIVGRGGPPVDIDYWTAITVTLLGLGAAAAGPWIVAVWASHGPLSQYRDEMRALPAVEPPGDSFSELDAKMALLLDSRQVIAASVGRLLTLVLGAVLLSGALRGALVPTFVSESKFPDTAVLAYGAFFTVMLSLAVIPLMLSWRRTAMMLLDQAYPQRVATSADDAAARERLVQALNLQGSPFTLPVALSSLLAPLITSLLTVFVPQLGT